MSGNKYACRQATVFAISVAMTTLAIVGLSTICPKGNCETGNVPWMSAVAGVIGIVGSVASGLNLWNTYKANTLPEAELMLNDDNNSKHYDQP